MFGRLLLFFAVAGVLAVDAAPPSPTPEYRVFLADSPIQVDGKFDEDAWKSAEPSPVFADIVDGLPARYPVKAKALWDDRYLYLAFTADDPDVRAKGVIRDDPMGLRIKGLDRPALKKETRAESFFKVYLAPDAIGRRYAEIHINPMNKVCDQWYKSPWKQSVCGRMNIPWEPGPAVPEWDCEGLLTAVTTRGTLNDPYDIDDGWQAEIAIPLTALKFLAPGKAFPPRVGDRWKAHLGRSYAPPDGNGETVYWTWPVLGVYDCHTPDKWGQFVFEGKRTFARTEKSAAFPKANFSWKALWVRHDEMMTRKGVQRVVELADRANIDVLIAAATNGNVAYYESVYLPSPPSLIDPLGELIKAAKEKGIKVYAWTVNLRAPDWYCKEHPELEQKIQPWEDAAAKGPRANPDRVNIHGGHWLCPDRGLDPFEKTILTELFDKYDLDGIGLDYVGYRNYYGCFCEFSIRKRLGFALRNPTLDAKEVLTRFSRESLVEWTRQARELVLKLKPGAKVAIHIYPDFDPDPLFGARLPVDYCGQTLSWFYKPFWSYGKILDIGESLAKEEGKYYEFNKLTPFIGVRSGDSRKSPERLRREIRTAGAVGSGAVMFAFDEAFLECPDLAEVLEEECR